MPLSDLMKEDIMGSMWHAGGKAKGKAITIQAWTVP